MLRFCATSLTALVIAVLGVTTASASTILDPIVRTKGGGGSIEISSLPFPYDFGAFPTDPDGDGGDCNFFDTDPDSEFDLPTVRCEFQNVTFRTISLLDFHFNIPGGGAGLDFQTRDPDGFWQSEPFIDENGVRFFGSGIPPAVCGGIDEICTGGHFFVDLIGVPNGTTIDMVASETPEPASLVLLGTGLGLGAALVSRRRRKSTRQH
jgi:hypothetical protein